MTVACIYGVKNGTTGTGVVVTLLAFESLCEKRVAPASNKALVGIVVIYCVVIHGARYLWSVFAGGVG